MSERIINYFLIFIIGLSLGWLLTLKFFPREKVTGKYSYTVNSTPPDTVKIIRAIQLPAKKDTIVKHIIIKDVDTVKITTTYAYADTTLEDNKLNLSVKYFFEDNYFDIKYKLKTLNVTTEKKKNDLFLGVGLGLGIGLKGGNIEPNVSIGLYYNIWGIK